MRTTATARRVLFVSVAVIVVMIMIDRLDACLFVVEPLEHVIIGFQRIGLIVGLRAQRRFLRSMFGLFAQQRVAVFLRDLIIIGMDFAEGEEAVAIAAVIDERRLQRRFDPRHLGKIDIPLELLALGAFEIKFLDPGSVDDGHAGFFPVACVDQHTRCHLYISGRAVPGHGGGAARDERAMPGRRRCRRCRDYGF